MKNQLPTVLTINGGFLDVAGFLALQGLFTGHITGNIVTLSAGLATGATGSIAKMLALPVYCVAVAFFSTLVHPLSRRSRPIHRRALLAIEMLLVSAGSLVIIAHGTFQDGDSWQAILGGMLLVSGMAVQNTVQRIHLTTIPPTTVMTGTITQLMIDFVHVMATPRSQLTESVVARVKLFTGLLIAFVVGAVIAAVLFLYVGVWCFIGSIALCILGLWLGHRLPEQA